ncbi:MAG: pilin [Luteimonas sp.]
MADIWFHTTPEGGCNGPMRADDLVRLFQAGRIHAATPVWHEGMTEWAALASVASTLGLPVMPPPLPRAAPASPRRGLHWIWITVLVLAALAVPTLAIIAAIAIPAYHDYRTRAGISEVVAASAPLRLALQNSAAHGETCPVVTGSEDRAVVSNPEVDTAIAGLLTSPHVADVLTLNRSTLDQCELLVKLEGFERAAINGEVLNWSLEPASGNWTCGTTVPHRYVPEHCRRRASLAYDIPEPQTGSTPK